MFWGRVFLSAPRMVVARALDGVTRLLDTSCYWRADGCSANLVAKMSQLNNSSGSYPSNSTRRSTIQPLSQLDSTIRLEKKRHLFFLTAAPQFAKRALSRVFE